MKTWVAQLRKGIVELAVLAALTRGEAYGYELLQRINVHPGLSLTESTVYPLLSRLTEEGVLKVRAAPSPAGPPRRYYRITAAGKARLHEMTAHWNEINEAVGGLMKGGM